MIAGRVSLLKSSGKLIEFQSRATQGTLIRNAVEAGFDPSEIEEREVTVEEYKQIRKKWVEDVELERKKEKKKKMKSKITNLKTKLNLTDQDLIDLKKVLSLDLELL